MKKSAFLLVLAASAVMVLPAPAAENSQSASILIDGEVADWEGITAAATDPFEGGNPCDWRKLFLAKDASHLFVRYTTEAAVDFNSGAAYMVLLDTDQSQRTGFQGSEGNFSIGADYLLQGLTLYKYAGTGTDWAWDSLGTVSGQTRANEAELAVPLDQLESPDAVNVILYGDNAALSDGEILDLLPDDALSPSGKVTFSLKD